MDYFFAGRDSRSGCRLDDHSVSDSFAHFKDEGSKQFPQHDVSEAGLGRPRTSRSLFTLVCRNLSRRPNLKLKVFTVWDSFAAALAVALGHHLSPVYNLAYASSAGPPVSYLSVLFLILFPFVGLAVGFYDRKAYRSHITVIVYSFVTGSLAWTLLLIVNYFWTYSPIGRWITLLTVMTMTFAAVLSRVVYLHYAAKTGTNILLIGTQDAAELIAGSAKNAVDSEINIVERMNHSIEPPDAELGKPLSSVDQIVVESVHSKALFQDLYRYMEHGVQVTAFEDFFENTFQKAPAGRLDPSWAVAADLNVSDPIVLGIKRCIDILAAVAGLCLMLMILPFVAGAIKLDSKGSVFYRQERLGKHGRRFYLVKFRTMIQGAEPDGAAVWAAVSDNRITGIGKILRRTRLDEFPQFINILKGDMSLVGPRPERPEFHEALQQMNPLFNLRLLVKPGLTGWAQIKFRYAADKRDALEKLCYDLYYLKHLSIGFDLKIIIQTVGEMMRGAR